MDKNLPEKNLPENNLIDTIHLDNGLVLKLYDRSRKIATDRWQVVCVAHVEVPVDDRTSAGLLDGGVDRADLRDLFGSAVLFEKVTERNFIDEDDRKPMVEEMLRSLVRNLGPYLSRPDFPGRFLMRKFQEYQRQGARRRMAK